MNILSLSLSRSLSVSVSFSFSLLFILEANEVNGCIHKDDLYLFIVNVLYEHVNILLNAGNKGNGSVTARRL